MKYRPGRWNTGHLATLGVTFKKMVFTCFSANLGLHCLKSNNVGRHFCLDFQGFCLNILGFCSDFQEFCQIFRDFAQIFRDFAWIFNKSKLLGVRLHHLHTRLLHYCIQRQLRYQYCEANKLRASFSRCSNAVKNLLFRSFLSVYVCITIMVLLQKATACKDCGWLTILASEL